MHSSSRKRAPALMNDGLLHPKPLKPFKYQPANHTRGFDLSFVFKSSASMFQLSIGELMHMSSSPVSGSR